MTQKVPSKMCLRRRPAAICVALHLASCHHSRARSESPETTSASRLTSGLATFGAPRNDEEVRRRGERGRRAATAPPPSGSGAPGALRKPLRRETGAHADEVQGGSRRHEAESVENGRGGRRHLGAVGVAVEHAECGGQRHRDGHGHAGASATTAPSTTTDATMPSSTNGREKPSAADHHGAEEARRHQPQRASADQSGEHADGHHRENMVEPADGMQETGDEADHGRRAGMSRGRAGQRASGSRRARRERMRRTVMGISSLSARFRVTCCQQRRIIEASHHSLMRAAP